ncbi:hypothetical protein [Leptospira vanthielii]|uniref:Uncharacterized protein n=2 Tax=Leptospira vanthielii TaxID=293085 RepID=A0ABY2NR82_9LEPT|nr:hypothetical protein [Leptospira vanthielii]EMY70796.1 hypothetical protein LEP1GSC199_4009 [Leptospira vanthielii serovar Holland str. Waz Holland = ATCC 700522]TGM59073.1 hypothetical protein EHQ95_04965 [Leptospira vanthielii]
MNPSFFKEGSSHFRFIEWEPGKSTGYAEKIELSFLAYDNHFLSNVKAEFGNEPFESYKIIWNRKVGKFKKEESEKRILFVYTESYASETKGSTLSALLENKTITIENKTQIEEFDIFELGGDTGQLIEEGIRSTLGGDNRWSHSLGSMEFFSSSTVFTKQTNNTIQSENVSNHYDYLQLRYEWNETESDKLFFKLIYKDNNTQLFFVPPYTNGLSSKTKEPFGYKRIGDFLLKEEMK